MAIVKDASRRAARRLADKRSRLWATLKSPRLRSWVFDDFVDSVLYALALSRPEAFFIQVGSNDASFGDPLHPFLDMARWRGIMIEPVPWIYARLVRKHGKRPGIVFENVAIASDEGVRPFYTVDSAEDDRHSWVDQLGSFKKDVILSHAHLIDGLASRIQTAEVQCVSLATLCLRHNVTQLDLLHVDTEGADFEVLKSHDWERLRPGVVLYEHKHLTASESQAAYSLLQGFDYRMHAQGGDTLAVHPSLLESSTLVKQAWMLGSHSGRAS